MANLLNARILAFLNLIDTDLGANATIKVYTGSMPATLDITATGTLLGTLTMDATNAFGAAVDAAPNATMTANTIVEDSSADATGTPAYARLATSGGTDIVQLTAGVGSGEVDFLTSFTSGQPIQMSSLVISMNE